MFNHWLFKNKTKQKKHTKVLVLEFANFYHVNTPAVLTISLLISNYQRDIIEQSWEEMWSNTLLYSNSTIEM